MKNLNILIIMMLLPLSITAQNISKNCKTCGKPIAQCQYKGKHPKLQPEVKCKTCGKAISRCEYNGKHLKPQAEAKCTTCGRVVSKCEYGGSHPDLEDAGYDVMFSCNVPSATLSLNGRNYGSANGEIFLKSGDYNVILTAEGYEPLEASIMVSSEYRSFFYTMKKIPVPTPYTLQVGGVVYEMVYIEGGTFLMGSNTISSEKPIHEVTLSDYYIGQTEVTQELWTAVMGNNPSKFKGDKLPVDRVSWKDCQKFIAMLNAKTGCTFRLPTEAEWEYAARGGKKSKGYRYSGNNYLDDVAWYCDNSGKKTHPVKSKLPNELGLYDMSGNVWEWCSDLYGDYSSGAVKDPTGPTSGSYRVFRGGSWHFYAGNCRPAYRNYDIPTNSSSNFGFRLALSPSR